MFSNRKNIEAGLQTESSTQSILSFSNQKFDTPVKSLSILEITANEHENPDSGEILKNHQDQTSRICKCTTF